MRATAVRGFGQSGNIPIRHPTRCDQRAQFQRDGRRGAVSLTPAPSKTALVDKRREVPFCGVSVSGLPARELSGEMFHNWERLALDLYTQSEEHSMRQICFSACASHSPHE